MLLASFSAVALAENIVFPADSGVVNVKNAPYNARGDGVTDDTAAIQAALNANNGSNTIIYLPNGTYLVSNRLIWPGTTSEQKRTILQGQSTADTIIRLKDNCTSPGNFTNPSTPREVIHTGGEPAQRFRNSIRNLTVHTGSGNPGAIGIRYYANNQGQMQAVKIISGDGQGVRGLDLAMSENGPCFVRDVAVDGFQNGIFAGGGNSVTLENITLTNQSVAGLNNTGSGNYGNKLFIRKLNYTGSAVAVRTKMLMVLLDATITGTAGATGAAVVHEGNGLLVRNLKVGGAFSHAIQNGASTVPGPVVEEWTSAAAVSQFPSPKRTLNLPIEETPTVPWDALTEWVSPLAYGGLPNDDVDDTAAIQSAVDSGKTTLYLPKGKWKVTGTVQLRNNIRRVIGCEAGFTENSNGTFNVAAGTAPTVVIERLDAIYSNFSVSRSANRTLVLSSITFGYRAVNFSDSADLFVEDICTQQLHTGSSRVWARQLNVEGSGNATPQVRTDGGKLWVLGLKTEGNRTKVEAVNGARSEIYAFIYANVADNTLYPMLINDNSEMTATWNEAVIRNSPFSVKVRETRGATTRNLGGGSCVLYCGYRIGLGRAATPPGTHSLTALGTLDWAKWARGATFDFDHKATGGTQISNWSAIGAGGYSRTYNTSVKHSWTDGTPVSSHAGSEHFVRVGGTANDLGYQFTVPASSTPRTLNVYVAAQYVVGGVLEVSLDDGSAPIAREAAGNTGSSTVSDYLFTIPYASENTTTLRVKWFKTSGNGNVGLRAAALR
jgi:hypothetical protein